MEINLSNAVKKFFPNPSLEMVYFEAIANSIDANAKNITINISIKSFADAGSLRISIADDGDGFNNKNYKKFGKLLQTEDEHHKGLGRLVYLQYFNKVRVESNFKNGYREFLFDENYQHNDDTLSQNKDMYFSTVLVFTEYKLHSIKKYDYLKPKSLKKSIENHFYPLLYHKKQSKEGLIITINLDVKIPNEDMDFKSDSQILDVFEISDLESVKFKIEGISMFDQMELFYSIKRDYKSTSINTYICSDRRTTPIDVISKENIPVGYDIVFLLMSAYFDGRMDNSRQKLDLKDSEIEIIKDALVSNVSIILADKIPQINNENKKIIKIVNDKYPHLQGLFKEESLGLISKDKYLEAAQRKFFLEQKNLLEADTLSEDQYQKSIEMSSRVLTEYVLYRNLIIQKIKSMDFSKSEGDIHDAIIPRKKTYKHDSFSDDLYNNNAWLLDDKYMSYHTILSDNEMNKIIKEIALEEEDTESDGTRPDITIIFSSDLEESKKIDVVVVELKKYGLKLAGKEEVISQLRQRARKLLNYYPNRIQRIWFYGVVDFDKEFIRFLKEEKYLEIYSKGQYYYKELEVIPDYDENIRVPIGINLLSIEAFIEDAQARNSAFLKILKDGIKKMSGKSNAYEIEMPIPVSGESGKSIKNNFLK